jgi:glycosyltransferase involved in cell wall biosynthesis
MTREHAGELLSVVMPAYQEARTIGAALERVRDVLDASGEDYEVVLVSDGCTDGTADKASEVDFPQLRVVHYDVNQGKGHALRTGFEKTSGETVVFIDSDLDIHASGIVTLLDQLRRDQADAVVASKVHPQSQVSYPRFRRLQSRVFREMSRVLFRLDVTDSQTGLKVFERSVLECCLPLVRSTGFAFDLELLVLANDAGFVVEEGPVELDYQVETTTGVRAVRDVIRDVLAIAQRRRLARRRGVWIAPRHRASADRKVSAGEGCTSSVRR